MKASAVSAVSLTGVSSGRVTSITWARSGSASISVTSTAWVRTGPTRTASSSPFGERRKVTAWPAAGPSTTITSAARARCSAFTFPSTRISFIPGTAVATMSSAPVPTSRFDIRPRPWVSRYSRRASSAASGSTVSPG